MKIAAPLFVVNTLEPRFQLGRRDVLPGSFLDYRDVATCKLISTLNTKIIGC